MHLTEGCVLVHRPWGRVLPGWLKGQGGWLEGGKEDWLEEWMEEKKGWIKEELADEFNERRVLGWMGGRREG